MNIIFETIFISFAVCYISIPVIISIAKIKRLYDEPSLRRVHEVPVPALGGVAIFAAVLISFVFFVSFAKAPELQYFIPSSIILFFIGLKDDLLVISPFKKFAGQLLAVFILVYKGGFLIDSFHGFLGYNDLGSVLSVVFTCLTILMIVNAFNLIDGVNGLAASLTIVSCTFFGVVFFISNQIPYSILSFSLVASLFAFLIFNWTPAKIFMGDTGSMFLGLINSILVIKFINSGEIKTDSFVISANALVGFGVLFIPLIDTLRVFAIRILSGKSPFYSDLNHIHHLLLKRGLSHAQVTLSLSFLAISYTILVISIQSWGINYGILLLFTLGILLPLFIDKSSYKIESKKTSIAQEEIIVSEINTKTIISTGPLSSEINN